MFPGVSGIVTKWVVEEEHRVTTGDLTGDGLVREQTLLDWIDRARSLYLERCPLLRGRAEQPGVALRLGEPSGARAAGLGPRPEQVIVTASAKEIHPTSFTIAVRLRPIGGDTDRPLNVTCSVHLEDVATGTALELGRDIRDELIALEHAAQHYN